jgi:branched-chain amino acid transport system permease protein
VVQFLDQAISAGLIPFLTATQVGPIRFILVGIGLMSLIIFRPQGIFGDRKELALDGR